MIRLPGGVSNSLTALINASDSEISLVFRWMIYSGLVKKFLVQTFLKRRKYSDCIISPKGDIRHLESLNH